MKEIPPDSPLQGMKPPQISTTLDHECLLEMYKYSIPMTQVQAGEFAGVTRGTVHTIERRAHRKLKTAFAEIGIGLELLTA